MLGVGRLRGVLGTRECETGSVTGIPDRARPTLAAGETEKVQKALMSTSTAHPHLVRDLFGVDEFAPWTAEGYDLLQDCTTQASKDGLLEGIETAERSSGRLIGR